LEKTCSVEGCERKHDVKEFCNLLRITETFLAEIHVILVMKSVNQNKTVTTINLGGIALFYHGFFI